MRHFHRFEYVTQTLIIGGLGIGLRLMYENRRLVRNCEQALMLLEEITRRLDHDVRATTGQLSFLP
jgi:hypothetical protein